MALLVRYRIYLAIRRGFHLSRMTTNTLSAVCNFAIIRVLPFLNNLKDLDPSYKTDLDLWDCFGRKKNPSYIRGNTVDYLRIEYKVMKKIPLGTGKDPSK